MAEMTRKPLEMTWNTVIGINDRQQHSQHLRAILRSLGRAGLTEHLKKCATGWVEAGHLGTRSGPVDGAVRAGFLSGRSGFV